MMMLRKPITDVYKPKLARPLAVIAISAGKQKKQHPTMQFDYLEVL